ncbi:MAG: sigma-70 family RNA polymerase sigma factor [Planctomycetes bacterium]|nr:sigma-70 family RNA polymerase sigma factor [Planctomycetota bacterium]
MVSPDGPSTASALRKLKPEAKLPAPAVRRALSPADKQTLEQRLCEPAECVYNPFFEREEAEQILMESFPRDPRRANNDDSGVDLLAPTTGQALTSDQEQHLFLRLNYCRFRVMRVLRQYENKLLSAEAARELLRWENRTSKTRSDIVRTNVPLVLAMGKRTKITAVDFADLISEGNLALLRAVDKFDCSRGFKFSTYACRAILKSFARVATRTARHRGHFPTEFDPTLEKGDFIEQKRRGVEGDCVEELKMILGNNRARLSETEERVIRARFALDEIGDDADGPRAKTLEQVGQMIGVTKERVRQIQNKALGKLRNVLEEGVLAN